MMRVGIVNPESWSFLRELHILLSSNYATRVFKPRSSRSPLFRERIEKHLLYHDLKSFLQQNDVVLFEWATHLLAQATHMPKSSRIITRLHRYELYAWADRINWDAVDQIILVSEAKRQEFLHRFPEQATKVHVIPVGISTQRFSCANRNFTGTIGTLCHLTPRKRIYDLVLTFSELVERVPSLRLHIAGDPDPDCLDYYASLLSLVDRLSLRQLVEFDGYIESPWEWYPKIDIFISNSFSEGLQVAPMEAMASGCYCLSHHWDGAEELLPQSHLYMTSSQLQEMIIDFCELPDPRKEDERVRMRQLAGERFDIEKSNQQICEIIEQSVRRYRATRGPSALSQTDAGVEARY
jgi:glycosyltransferase involved in cell wall biosynthesis